MAPKTNYLKNESKPKPYQDMSVGLYVIEFATRMKNVTDTLLSLSDDLKSIGYTIYHHDRLIISEIVIFKDDMKAIIEYDHSPFCWKLKVKRKGGTELVIEDKDFGEALPFTMEDIRASMASIEYVDHAKEAQLMFPRWIQYKRKPIIDK